KKDSRNALISGAKVDIIFHLTKQFREKFYFFYSYNITGSSYNGGKNAWPCLAEAVILHRQNKQITCYGK
ncbi:MAG: hypothetical protein MJZ93_06420, partial [Paludibacteraceae bacterium]|nr:hypothetical protein [Paludibacteraceae bacterium]